MNLLKKLTYLVIGFLGIGFVLGWLLLSSSLLSGPRASLTEWVLQSETGQTVEIDGGVTIGLGSILQVSAQKLSVPGKTADALPLAAMETLAFDVALGELLRGDLKLSNLVLDGASVVLEIDKDGSTDWAMPDKPQDPKPAGSANIGKTFSNIFADHRIELTNSDVTYHDARNGFEFGLHLSELSLSRETSSAPIKLRGEGTLNEQALSLNGDFLPAEPFKADLSFEKLRIDLVGTPNQAGYEAGFSVSANATIDDLGQVQKILLLNDVLEGGGQAKADIVSKDGQLFVGNADALITLVGGQSVELARTLGPSGGPDDAVLDTTIRLVPKDNEPPATTVRRDLKLVSVYMQLANRIDDVPLRKMIIATNGFVIDTAGVGPPPVTVSGISRSPEGLLRLGDVTLRLGPTDAPFVILQGAVNNALELEQVDIGGDLSLPIASLLSPELFQASDLLGQITGGFRLTGDKDRLTLADLNGVSSGTDLWKLDVTGSVGDVLTLNDIDLAVSASVPSGAKLLEKMDLKPVETGAVELGAKLSSEQADWRAQASVGVAESQLDLDVSFDANDPHPIVRGSVTSDLLKVAHIRDLVAAAIQIGRLGDLEEAEKEKSEGVDEDSVSEPAKEDEAGPFRDMTLTPLGRSILLSGMDLSIGIDLQKIEGPKGTTSLTSNLVLDDDKAQLGPVEFSYGGGHFNLTGAVDLKESPEIVSIKGSTGGWDVGKIAHDLNFKKGISGILHANFEVAGAHTSVQDFLKTTQGWTTVSMSKGSIETQLLDIAGLGILPWLFTKGKGDRAPIVCLRAPMHIANGRVSSKEIVVETDQVQIVVYGEVNLGKKTLEVHGQPRRIGKPLSRSPWPFSVSGALSDPKVEVKDGPRKVKRSDGASKMPAKRKHCVPDILQLQ